MYTVQGILATNESDIDIAVEISAPMGLNFIAMADEIEDLFGIKTNVVTKRSIKPEFLRKRRNLL